MRIGVPKEIKIGENRVGLVPTSVRELVAHGHTVIIEHDAGKGIGFDDNVYRTVGATVVDTAAAVYADADMIIKVKEPQPTEFPLLRRDQILFTYLHLAPDPEQTAALIASGCIGIAYETVTDVNGRLPLLSPASEVAGRFAVQAGAHCLEKAQGGCGILLGGVPGVKSGNVVVIGGGVLGTNAARMAMGLEARVTVLDKSLQRLQELDLQFGSKLRTLYATSATIEDAVLRADLVIGAVLVPGGSAPKVVTRAMLQKMHPGSVIVDASIDQGGCFETSRPTTHDDPTYMVDGIVHYCVTNMPGAVPRTATFALNNATLPFILEIANKGYKKALLEDEHLCNGLNIYKGHVTYPAVAAALGKEYMPAKEALVKF